MTHAKNNFVLGLVTIAILVLFMGTVMFIYPLFQGGGRQIVIHFRVADGMAPLKEGSGVLLGGSVRVGRVESVAIEEITPTTPPDAPQEAVFVVRVSLDDNVPLYNDCEISTAQPTIGDSGYVLIERVGTPGQVLQQPINGTPPQGFAVAIAALQDRLLGPNGIIDRVGTLLDPDDKRSFVYKTLRSLDDLNAMTGELRSQLNPQQQTTLLAKLHRTMDDINTATAALRTEMQRGDNEAALAKVHLALDRLDTALADVAAIIHDGRPRIDNTLASVEHATTAIDRDIVAALRQQLDVARADSMIAKAHQAFDRVNETLTHVGTTVQAGEELLVLNRPQLEQTLENFGEMSDNLRQTSQEVLLNPSKLIWGPDAKRDEQLVVFQAARNFAEAATELDRVSQRLQALLATMPAEGGTVNPELLEQVQGAVRAAFERFKQAEDQLWEQLK